VDDDVVRHLDVDHFTRVDNVPLLICVATRLEISVTRGVRLLKVTPPMPGHQVAICYQIREFGPGLRILVQVIRELSAKNKPFVQRSSASH